MELVVGGLPGECPGEAMAVRQGGIDLPTRVVVLEPDRHMTDLGQPAHDVPSVGCHQVREVGGALRSGQPEQDVHVAVRRHFA